MVEGIGLVVFGGFFLLYMANAIFKPHQQITPI